MQNQPEEYNKVSELFECSDYGTTVFPKLQTIYTKGHFCDVQLIAEEDQVKCSAHKLILSASSSYLFEILQRNPRDIQVKNIDGLTLESVIGYIYTGNIELCRGTVRKVLRLAQLFELDSLKIFCCEFMGKNLDNTNCLSALLLAEEHNYIELHSRASVYAYTHFDEVCAENEFFELNYDQVNEFLFGADMCPEKVFFNLAAWVNHDLENREVFLHDLLSYVRYELLTPRFIVENRHLVCRTSKCYELICSWMEWHLIPKKELQAPQNNNRFAYVDEDFTYYSVFRNKYSNYWNSPLESKGKSKTKAKNRSAIVINQKMIAAGGEIRGQYIDKVECFDLQTNELSFLPPLNCARCRAGMAELNGNLYVIGGYKDGKWLKSVEKYDFLKEQWEDVASLNTPLANIKVAVVDGILYAVGNDRLTMNCYNPISKQWKQRILNIGEFVDLGIANNDGELYAVGKREEDSKEYIIQCYNRKTNSWVIKNRLESNGFEVETVGLNGHLVISEQTKSKVRLSIFIPGSNYCRKDERDINVSSDNWIGLVAMYGLPPEPDC